MSLDQTRDGLSRREALGLGLAGWLTSLRPKSAGARTGDEKRSTKIFFHANRKIARNEAGGNGIFAVDPENDSWQFVIEGVFARVSPDGGMLAYLDTGRREQKRSAVRLLDLDTKETKLVSELVGESFWSPDGKELIVSGSKTGAVGARRKLGSSMLPIRRRGCACRSPRPTSSSICRPTAKR